MEPLLIKIREKHPFLIMQSKGYTNLDLANEKCPTNRGAFFTRNLVLNLIAALQKFSDPLLYSFQFWYRLKCIHIQR